MVFRSDQALAKSVRTGQLLLLFGIFYILVWKNVDLRIVYHGGGLIGNAPVFYWGADFFKEWFPQPAGILGYVRALLFQTFFYSWLGAATVTLLAALIYGLWGRLSRESEHAVVGLAGFVPGIFLLGAFGRHVSSVPALNTSCCMLAALVLAWGFASLGRGGPLLRSAAVLVAATAILYSFPGALVLFLLIVLVLELERPDRWTVLVAVGIAGLGLPQLIGMWGYDLSRKESFAAMLPFPATTRFFRNLNLAWLYVTYFVLPPMLLAARAWLGPTRKPRAMPVNVHEPAGNEAAAEPKSATEAAGTNRQSKGPSAALADAKPIRSGAQGGWMRWSIGWAVLMLGMFGVCHLSINPEIRGVLRADYAAYHQDWKGVLAAARDNTNSIHVECELNQALFHLGRLGDDVNLRQNPEALVLYDANFRPDWNVIDVYLDLGFVGMAHHYLVEAMDIYGERPALLRRLVLVNTVLGNVGTAKIYLSALTKVPFHAAWARQYLAEIEANPSKSDDKEVMRLRDLMMTRDQVIPLPIDKLMLGLLEVNPRNRMAFEYLMAYYLMTRNVQGFIGQLPRLSQFSLGELPRYYQEAIVLAGEGLGMNVDLPSQRISSSTTESFRKFMQVRKDAGPNVVSPQLTQEFGTSYYYYYFVR